MKMGPLSTLRRKMEDEIVSSKTPRMCTTELTNQKEKWTDQECLHILSQSILLISIPSLLNSNIELDLYPITFKLKIMFSLNPLAIKFKNSIRPLFHHFLLRHASLDLWIRRVLGPFPSSTFLHLLQLKYLRCNRLKLKFSKHHWFY